MKQKWGQPPYKILKEQRNISQNSNSQGSNETIYTVIGVVIGAVLALIFVKTGSSGLIGVGAMLGMMIGKALNQRFNKTN